MQHWLSSNRNSGTKDEDDEARTGGEREGEKKGKREGMWAETCKYLPVIHNVNHRHRCQRDRRGRGKGTEGGKRGV